MTSITADAVAEAFLTHVYMHHGLPLAITSDRGPQFVNGFWARLCELLHIQRRLSTAFHPQSDGSTERANQEVERVLRVFTSYAQDDWGSLLPVVAMAINNREATSTGLSPFFFTHGYHIDPVALQDAKEIDGELQVPEQAGEAFVKRLEEATNWAQAALAVAQDQQQEQANRNRQAAPVYRTGDKVWLNLKNIRTERWSKKLDWTHAKYTVVEVPTPLTVRLDVPTGIHPVFHVELVRPAATDPLPSQVVDDTQPPPIKVDGHSEWQIDEILAAKTQGRTRIALVKWTGYAELTWHNIRVLQDCSALDDYEQKYGDVRTNNGPLHLYDGPSQRKSRRKSKRKPGPQPKSDPQSKSKPQRKLPHQSKPQPKRQSQRTSLRRTRAGAIRLQLLSP
ncbi:hypothetical protein EYZ11_012225 [Aspergillus tanneri]|uniref:Integrase catalytic domain-containing protein n=1 Tax=Aspergillus tanneri TaxID=1220188 RepID=A0A4S3J2W5_9EURO|nr:hypothetical protein EYZ11_012225 [Aspergillus tanneri]